VGSEIVSPTASFLAERLRYYRYVTFGLWREPSVCRLSSVCDVVAPKAETWIFRQYFCNI